MPTAGMVFEDILQKDQRRIISQAQKLIVRQNSGAA